MADPFVAEIRIFPFNFAPKGWAWCDGQLLPLSQNTALFSLLGTTYGGDGKSNFALPDLQGRAPMHPGPGPGSVAARSRRDRRHRRRSRCCESEMPAHSHAMHGRSTSPGECAPRRRGRWPGPPAETLYKPSSANLVRLAPERLRPPAATSRTTTCSPT